MNKTIQALLTATAIAGAAMSADAQTAPATPAPTVAQGATVYDTAGAVVGTIKSVDGQFATLATAKSTVKLPVSSFGAGEKGPLLAMTAAQVDDAASAAAPPAQPAGPPKLAAGTAVNDPSGKPVGTIESIDGQFATLATANSKVRLPITAFASGENGPMIAMTAEQLDAAAAQAQPKTGKN